MYKLMTRMIAVLFFLFCSVNTYSNEEPQSLGIPPLTISLDASTINLVASSTTMAPYLVSVSSLVPHSSTALTLAITTSQPWATINTTVDSACTTQTVTCTNPINLYPGANCCLMLNLNGTYLTVGANYTLMPSVATAKNTYRATAHQERMTVETPAAFSANPTTGTAPLAVVFTDESTNSPSSWAWTFGNGSTSGSQSPTYTYNVVGEYTVTLVETGEGGTYAARPQVITVKTPAAFSATPTTGAAPLTVVFTDESTNSPYIWEWDFGDGSTSTNQNPIHTYTDAGRYTVTLREEGTGGFYTALPQVITVL